MNLSSDHLQTLIALVDSGSFDRASVELGITPSAVSQRMRAMETMIGRPLVTRSRPLRPTDVGQTLLRYARQRQALLAEGALQLGMLDSGSAHVVLVVHADSLSTWALSALATVEQTTFEFILDEGGGEDALREGAASAAITTSTVPMQGFTTVALGAMRYRPVASPDFIRQWFPDGMSEASVLHAPFICRAGDGSISHRSARSGQLPPVHRLPMGAEAATALELGLGWAMLPELMTAGRNLAIIEPGHHSDVLLFWRHSAVESARLDRIATAIRAAAATALLIDPLPMHI